MRTEIGIPAIINPGGQIPTFEIYPNTLIYFDVKLIFEKENSVISTLRNFTIGKSESSIIAFDDILDDEGTYRVDFIISYDEGKKKNLQYESFYFSVLNSSSIPRWNSLIVHPGNDGKLRYIPDYRGNHIPDFSTAGYKGGGVAIPDVPVLLTLEPSTGDDTQRIQDAIDHIASLPLGPNGFRGAILLKKGIYEIESSLEINESGIVIKGEGFGDIKKNWLDPSRHQTLQSFKNSLGTIDGTLIIATSTERRSLINVRGESSSAIDESSASKIIDQYVPVGAKSFRVNNPQSFNVGEKVIIQRSGNADWINAIGMDQIPQSPAAGSIPPVPWQPFNLNFERRITAIEGNKITIDGSIHNAIEKKWGGGRIYKFNDNKRIFNVGIENLRAISFWKPDQHNVDDTKHAHRFLSFNNIRDAWVNNVVMEHFYALGGALYVSRGAKQITIKNSSNLIADPKYYSGTAYRQDRINIETGVEVGRYGFYLEGHSNLVMGCYTNNDRRSFAVGSFVPGPNVFLDCLAENSLSTSEPHHRWSTGGLYDNVADNISVINRLYHGTGQGWAGANYVTWNTIGRISVEQPPTAQNWSIGHKGKPLNKHFPDFDFKEGYFDLKGSNVLPRSLYIQQLKDRIGNNFVDALGFNQMMLREKPDDIKVWNYPNPADYFTFFVFTLEEVASVMLSVFSIEGKQLAQVDFGSKDAGYYEVIWEISDDRGRPLSNGVYIYKLIVNNQISSNKLLISR